MTDKRLAPGDPAPDFTLPDADGHPVALSSFRGQRVIVYFYPAAMTPGCTKESCDFRDSRSDLSDAGFWGWPLATRRAAFATLRAAGHPPFYAEPESPLVTWRAGHPMLISMMSAPSPTAIRAPSAIHLVSQPAI